MKNDIQSSPSTSTDAKNLKNESNSRKRHAPSTNETAPLPKRFIPQQEDEGAFKLLDFTDEVLLEILQNCNSTTLYALSK